MFISKFVREYALDCLSQRAIKNENSKYGKILKGELVREKYLTDKRFIQIECELLFSIRMQMIPGIRTNLLSCVNIAGEANVPNNIKYVYGSVNK